MLFVYSELYALQYNLKKRTAIKLLIDLLYDFENNSEFTQFIILGSKYDKF